MLRNLQLKSKILVILIITGLVVIGVYNIMLYNTYHTQTTEESKRRLVTIRQLLQKELQDYFGNIKTQLSILSKTKEISELHQSLIAYKDSLKLDDYESFNTSTKSWDNIYLTEHEFLRNVLKVLNAEDLYIVNKQGQITFSYRKERELGDNLTTGRLKNNQISLLWNKVMRTGNVMYSDMEFYIFGDQQVSFYVGSPIRFKNEISSGALILRYKNENINNILANSNDGSNSLESILIGSDFYLRSNSKSVSDMTELRIRFKNELINNSLSGLESFGNMTDYRGLSVFASSSPVNVTGQNWVLLTKIDESEYHENSMIVLYWIISLVFGFVVFIFTINYYLNKLIITPLQSTRSVIKLLSKGKNIKNQTETYFTSLEFSEINDSVKDLIDNIKQTSNFAHQIGNGELAAQHHPLGEEDILGNSLLKLRDNLLKTNEEEKKRKEDERIRAWSTEGYTMFSDIMRQNLDNIFVLAQNVVFGFVKYLDVNVAGIFLLYENEGSEPYLELLSSYAYDREKFLKKRIGIDEGLIGQCIKEKKTTHLNKIPENYIKITSGLGHSKPNNLLLVPLKNETQVLGVLELGGLKIFEKYQIEFVEKIAESIASTLSGAKIAQHSSELLKTSRNQAENMLTQEENMRRSIEDILSSKEEVMNTNDQMRMIINAIDRNMIRAELDIDGNVIQGNPLFLETFDFKDQFNLYGKPISFFVTPDDGLSFKDLWSNIMNGIPQEITLKCKGNTGREFWLLAHFAPVMDNGNLLTKVYILASNITEQKLTEEQSNILVRKFANEEKKIKEMLRNKEDLLKKQTSDVELIENTLKLYNSAMASMVIEETGKIKEYNQSMAKLLNLKNENDFIGQSISILPTIETKYRMGGDFIVSLPIAENKLWTKSVFVTQILEEQFYYYWFADDITQIIEAQDNLNMRISDLNATNKTMENSLINLHEKQAELNNSLVNKDKKMQQISNDLTNQIAFMYNSWNNQIEEIYVKQNETPPINQSNILNELQEKERRLQEMIENMEKQSIEHVEKIEELSQNMEKSQSSFTKLEQKLIKNLDDLKNENEKQKQEFSLLQKENDEANKNIEILKNQKNQNIIQPEIMLPEPTNQIDKKYKSWLSDLEVE